MSLQMHFPIPEGDVIFQWPKNISTDYLDLVEEALQLQLRSIRRCALGAANKRIKDGITEYESWFPPITTHGGIEK